jgi:N-terminal domain of anti-restriction factor ArdC
MSSIATTNETSNVTSLPTAPKPHTSKEVIAANVKLLIEQLEAGHSEGLTAYLTAMGKFHNYSFGNILEIARQMPSASRVAGMYAWNQLGRRVKKGQKGIRILAPMIGTKRKKDKEADKDITKKNEPVLAGFRAVYVFDRLSRDLRPARVCHLNRTTPSLTCRSMRAVTSSLSFRAYRKDDDGVLMDVL